MVNPLNEDYEIGGGINAYDGMRGVLGNLRQAIATNPGPNQTKTENTLQPVLISGVIPLAADNIVSAITAKQDKAGKDVGIGIYPISQTKIQRQTL